MNERLLEAERLLLYGLADRAENVYRAVLEEDARNATALVGLARVALERGDEQRALELAREALAAHPDDDAARRMADRLEEVAAARTQASAPERSAADRPAAHPSEEAVFGRNPSMADHRRREERK